MPNWTTNTLRLKGPQDQLIAIRDLLAGEGDDKHIDFNKIKPMPAILKRVISPPRGGPNGRPMLEPENGDGMSLSDSWVEATEEQFEELKAISADSPPGPMARIGDGVKLGITDWYSWSVDNWGTKWNACHTDEPELTADELTFRFDTAWDAPRAFYDALIERVRTDFPDVSVEAVADHEDDGYEKII